MPVLWWATRMIVGADYVLRALQPFETNHGNTCHPLAGRVQCSRERIVTSSRVTAGFVFLVRVSSVTSSQGFDTFSSNSSGNCL